MPRLGRPSGYKYSREGVERALTHHFGKGGALGWASNGAGGYTISTGIGIFELKTLREAVLVVVAMAEKERRLLRSGQERRVLA